jgi:MOSC domain-containing protein YiiM
MRVLHVCVGRAREVHIGGRRVMTAIAKCPAGGPVPVRLLGLEGDEQADLTVHGGLAKAIYAYPHEHYAFWQTVRAQAGVAPWGETLPPGSLGENLTLEGLLEEQLWIGDRLHIGKLAPAAGCVLAVSEPRAPCFKLDAALGFAHAAKLMAQSGWCGAYLAVLEPGFVQAGDAIELIPGPREVNLRQLFRARAPSGRAAP